MALITDKVDLSVWKHRADIKRELTGIVDVKDLERAFRYDIAVNNELFLNGEADHYIVHSVKGYKWAENESEIELSIKDLETKAFTMLKSARRVRKALADMDQGALNEVSYFRKKANMTADQLVKLAKEKYPSCTLDVPTLSRIETGKVLPNTESMLAIADVLEVSPVKLFGSYAILI